MHAFVVWLWVSAGRQETQRKDFQGTRNGDSVYKFSIQESCHLLFYHLKGYSLSGGFSSGKGGQERADLKTPREESVAKTQV